MPQHSAISWEKQENEAFNSVRCAYEPTSWELWSQGRSYGFSFLWLFFLIQNSPPSDSELCPIIWVTISLSLPRIVPIVQAHLLIVTTLTLKSAPV